MLSTNFGGSSALHDGHSSGITTSGSSASQNGHLKSMHVLPRGNRAMRVRRLRVASKGSVIETPT